MVFGIIRYFRRRALRRRPFPDPWRAIIRRNFPLYARLPPADREELERLVQIFVAEKSYEGCGGQVIDDEVKVTIAAQACLLLLHRDTDVYPRLDAILVYPNAVRTKQEERDGLVVRERASVRLGESWTRGIVVLSWSDVIAGARDQADGHNVTLHELAHQLDGEDGAMDGAPQLADGRAYAHWGQVLGDEHQALLRRLAAGRRGDIDPYGAQSPPEFFAVITEMFFERPAAMRRRHPELYDELAAFFRQDPASWSGERASPTGAAPDPASEADTKRGRRRRRARR